MALLAVACALLVPASSAAQSPPSTSSLLVKLVDGLSAQEQADVIARDGGIERSVIPVLRLHVIDVPASDLATVRASYQADPQVVSVEENRTRVSETVPGDPLYPNQWALPQIGWDQVFGTVAPAGTATVALLDTGVDAFHPDLAGTVVPGTSILDGSNGMTDPSGHGTWLAGIIAAQTDNVPVEGIAGVAYAGVTVMPVTVLNVAGEGQDSDIIAGVIWAADHGADVILMAFSNPGFSPNLPDAIDYAWSKGAGPRGHGDRLRPARGRRAGGRRRAVRRAVQGGGDDRHFQRHQPGRRRDGLDRSAERDDRRRTCRDRDDECPPEVVRSRFGHQRLLLLQFRDRQHIGDEAVSLEDRKRARQNTSHRTPSQAVHCL